MALPRDKEEIQALDKFRPLVNDLKFGDGVLMRFLRARNLDARKAEDMIRMYAEYKEDFDSHSYLEYCPPIELHQLEVLLCGFDDEGRPVLWASHGHWPSGRDFYELGFGDQMILYAKKVMAKLYQILLHTKHQQFSVLVDNDGMTFSKMYYEARNWKAFSILMNLLKEYEANYPELLNQAFMLNTPAAFMWGWKFIRPCLGEQTTTKIQFYGSADQEKLKESLFSQLPSHCIPSKYGGTCDNPVNLLDVGTEEVDDPLDLVEIWENRGNTTKRKDSAESFISR